MEEIIFFHLQTAPLSPLLSWNPLETGTQARKDSLQADVHDTKHDDGATVCQGRAHNGHWNAKMTLERGGKGMAAVGPVWLNFSNSGGPMPLQSFTAQVAAPVDTEAMSGELICQPAQSCQAAGRGSGLGLRLRQINRMWKAIGHCWLW